MFIGDYPNIHDGSLLYLVQLEGGSRMKVEFRDERCIYTNVKLSKHWPVKYCYQTRHFYVNHIKVRRTEIQMGIMFSKVILLCPLLLKFYAL